MKISDTVDLMSSMYLERIVKSIINDYPRGNESFYRDEIKKNAEELSNFDKIQQRYQAAFLQNSDPYSENLLSNFVLTTLLDQHESKATEDKIINNVLALEKNIIDQSKESKNFKHIDDRSLDIFNSVMEVALSDEKISPDELNLIIKLRKKLGINVKDQYLIQASLGLFPLKENNCHSINDIRRELDDLQKMGLLFFCNRPNDKDEPFFIIPEEMLDGVKRLLDIELTEEKFIFLLQKLKNNQLAKILSNFNFNQYGTKDELVERIIRVGIINGSMI